MSFDGPRLSASHMYTVIHCILHIVIYIILLEIICITYLIKNLSNFILISEVSLPRTSYIKDINETFLNIYFAHDLKLLDS